MKFKLQKITEWRHMGNDMALFSEPSVSINFEQTPRRLTFR